MNDLKIPRISLQGDFITSATSEFYPFAFQTQLKPSVDPQIHNLF